MGSFVCGGCLTPQLFQVIVSWVLVCIRLIKWFRVLWNCDTVIGSIDDDRDARNANISLLYLESVVTPHEPKQNQFYDSGHEPGEHGNVGLNCGSKHAHHTHPTNC